MATDMVRRGPLAVSQSWFQLKRRKRKGDARRGRGRRCRDTRKIDCRDAGPGVRTPGVGGARGSSSHSPSGYTVLTTAYIRKPAVFWFLTTQNRTGESVFAAVVDVVLTQRSLQKHLNDDSPACRTTGWSGSRTLRPSRRAGEQNAMGLGAVRSCSTGSGSLGPGG